MIVMTSVPQQSSTSAHVTEFHCRWFARWRFVLTAPVNQWLPVSDGDLSGPVDVLAACPLLINAIVPKVLTAATDLDCIFTYAANFTFPLCQCVGRVYVQTPIKALPIFLYQLMSGNTNLLDQVRGPHSWTQCCVWWCLVSQRFKVPYFKIILHLFCGFSSPRSL